MIETVGIEKIILAASKYTVFDEPEAGIDLWSFSNLIEVFERMRNLIKGTTLIISHQERILNIADEIILMKQGKIEKIGNTKEILESNIKGHAECCKIKREGAK